MNLRGGGTPHRGKDEEGKALEQWTLATVLVGDGANQQLSGCQTKHTGSQTGLNDGLRLCKVRGQFGQTRQIEVCHKRTEGGQVAQND